METDFIIVETTYANLDEAKKLAEILLKKKLAACIHFLPIESLYLWQGDAKNASEILVRIKARNTSFWQIKKIIKNHHEYKIPQIIAISINQGSKSYLDWLDTTVV